MINAIMTFGIVVVPHVAAPPPAPTPPSTGQNECKYSAMINNDRYHPIYQCYTQTEWDQRNADIAAQQAQVDKENQRDAEEFGKWWSTHWWNIPMFIALIIASRIAYKSNKKRMDMKRYPYKYDDNGKLKYPWST